MVKSGIPLRGRILLGPTVPRSGNREITDSIRAYLRTIRASRQRLYFPEPISKQKCSRHKDAQSHKRKTSILAGNSSAPVTAHQRDRNKKKSSDTMQRYCGSEQNSSSERDPGLHHLKHLELEFEAHIPPTSSTIQQWSP